MYIIVSYSAFVVNIKKMLEKLTYKVEKIKMTKGHSFFSKLYCFVLERS